MPRIYLENTVIITGVPKNIMHCKYETLQFKHFYKAGWDGTSNQGTMYPVTTCQF